MENIWSSSTYQINDLSGPIIGIDFGTSNSCVAIWNPHKNRVKIFKNKNSSQITHSTVRFGKDFENYVIGTSGSHHDVPLVCGSKKFLGTMKNIDEKYMMRCFNEKGDTMLINPEVISSYILMDLKKSAENYLQKKKRKEYFSKYFDKSNDLNDIQINRAVIGIPANFSINSKKSLKVAAELAGFKEIHFMIESSAAAMSYGLLVAGKKTVLIIDIGGGTTDITILRLDNGYFIVDETYGHSACGGTYFDELFMTYILNKLDKDETYPFAKWHQHHGLPLLSDWMTENNCPVGYASFLNECCRCKELLTSSATASLSVPLSSLAPPSPFVPLAQDNSLPAPLLTREDLSAACNPLFVDLASLLTTMLHKYSNRTDILTDLQIPLSIDEIVFTGGSSLIPAIRKVVIEAVQPYAKIPFQINQVQSVTKESFNHQISKDICTAIDPNFAVVEGLAIRAAILNGEDIKEMRDILMLDSLPCAVGLLAMDQNGPYFEAIVAKGTSLPVTVTRRFCLESSHQKRITINVYEEIEIEILEP